MSNIAKLKKKAAELEAKKHYEKAVEIYEQVLNTPRAADEERDVALYNRVGDLHYRLGNNEQAINYYEQAADFYADGGFFNNAIALCNKVLRYSPGRTVIYYKLGLISAKKGFNSDAKQNFLEYADRMQRIGKMDEAFRALKEFADLCPGQDDVRLMLADQLAKANKKEEALEQLEVLYDTLEAEGRSSEATATLERMKTLDPAFKPRRSITPKSRKKDGLVFLDLDFDEPALADSAQQDEAADEKAQPPGRTTPAGPSTPATPPEGFVEVPRADAPDGLELTSLADEPEPAAEPIVALDIEPTNLEPEPVEPATVEEPVVHSSELVFITPIDPEEAAADESESEKSEPEESAPVSAPEAEPVQLSYDEGDKAPRPDDEFIDLGEWLEKNRTPASTRMVAHDEEPENDEQKDFGEMLDKFKEGISRNVDEEDFESHYDLGIAFREMGLLDEAIGSFQKASRGASQRVRAAEAIGQCFMDKGEAGVTLTVLERLVGDPSMSDAQLVGVLYLLGRAAESLSRYEEAAAYYQRVLAVQIGFRDAANRLSSLAQASR
jgi:tetratricopeptide (TPR) repeat protein